MKFYGEPAVELANSVFPANWRKDDIIVIIHAVENDVSSMCILNKFEEHSVELTFAHFNRLAKISDFAQEVFDEIFIHQDKKVAIMITASKNSKMNILHKRLGHTQSGRIPNRFGDDDGILYTITKEEAERLWLERFAK